MGRFVFIEGLPGTGKSSIAKNLADSLAAQGISTRLILEAAPENPLRFNTGTDQSIDVVRFVNSIMKQWVKFTQAQAGAYEEIIIIDGMVFQQQVNFLYWMNANLILQSLMAEIFKSIDAISAQLIFFRRHDPIEAMMTLMAARGNAWIKEKILPIDESPFGIAHKLGYPQALEKFVNEIQAANDDLFEKWPTAKTLINVSDNDWQRINLAALAAAQSIRVYSRESV